MNAEAKIREALKDIMDEGDANACQIYKGNDYDGVLQAYGWWYRPFGQNPVYLGGASVAQAIATIEEIKDAREDDYSGSMGIGN